MKRPLATLAAGCLFALASLAQEITPPALDALLIDGKLEGDNATFTITFTLPGGKPATLPLVSGDVAFLKASLPAGATIHRIGNALVLTDPGRGGWFRFAKPAEVSLTFASRVVTPSNGLNQTNFRLPYSTLRRITVTTDKPDTDVDFPTGRNLTRQASTNGQLVISAFLASGGDTTVRWKPQLRKRDGELVASCEANVIAATTVGALRLDSLFTYRISQGALQKMEVRVPAGVNVTEVSGAEIQDWKLGPESGGVRILAVTLRRPWDSSYRLQVTADIPLPDMPCQFELPVLQPLGVMRTSGFLMAGADTAVKLVLLKTAGLTQIDQAAFPVVIDGPTPRAKPQRNAFAWQYANLPYTLAFEADDIVPEYSSDDRLVLTVEDRDLVLAASSEIEFRDAAAREAVFETDLAWAVASVSGEQVADYDVRDAGKVRQIRLYFKTALTGRTLVEVRLERSLDAGKDSFVLPPFRLVGAKGQRGYVVAAAETGLRLKPGKLEGLREVHAGAIPVRVPDAQLAYRFRDASWSAELAVERTKPSLYAEVFNLGSIGEGVLYGSASINYHIGGAPARALKLRIPARLQNIEFTGRDIRNWSHTGDVWTVTLQEKVIGAYTLLVTFDQRMAYDAADFDAGGIAALETEGEVGYLVIASEANLALAEKGAAGLIRIDREEIPASYALLVNNPVVAAYKYVGNPPAASFAFTRFDTERLIDQVVDHTTLATTLSRDGETVTTVTYFIKNASQQYLPVVLPKGATLWSVRTGTESGTLSEVSPLKGESATLIPIGRLRDPNTPFKVELTYASAATRLGALGGVLRLEAPLSPHTQATFARWSVQAPPPWRIRVTGGTLLPDQPLDAGLWQVLRNVVILWGVPFKTAPFAGVMTLAALAALALLLFAAARGKGVGLAIGLALLLLVGGLILAAFAQSFASDRSDRSDWSDLSVKAGNASVSASRMLNVSGSQPLAIEIDTAPAWLGTGFRRNLVLACLAVGLLALIGAGFRRSAGMLGLAGATLFAVGAAGFTAGRFALTAALGALPPLCIALALLTAAFRAGRNRRPPDKSDPSDLSDPSDSVSPSTPSMPSTLALLLLLAGAMAAAAEPKQQAPVPLPPPPPPDLVLQEVRLDLQAPAMNRESEPSIRVTGFYRLTADRPGEFSLAGAEAVLTETALASPYLKVVRTERGYRLLVARAGTYAFKAAYVLPATVEGAASDSWAVRIEHPAALSLEDTLTIPADQVDVYAVTGAARKEIREETARTVVRLLPTHEAVTEIRWKTRARDTKLEQAVFYSETLTYAAFEPGVVELSSLVSLQIAQGQLQAVMLDIPAGMSVTAVAAPGLSTWRYDSDTRQLEALFEKPVSGNLTLSVTLQVPREGLPYSASLAALTVRGAARQRGAIALAVPDAVQITVTNTVGVSPMAIEDFPHAAQPAARATIAPRTLKRAYRFQQPPATLTVDADRVLPELRAVETATLSIGDERIVLASQLDVTVARAGIFSLALGIPAGYDVETLTGQDVSHWDDSKDATNRGVVVYFQKQVLDTRRLNVVLSRTEKGIEPSIPLPRIEVRNAVKHTGTLIVSGERGVRLSTAARDGVVESNPRELGVSDPRALAYSLLRPGWSVTLSAEVLAPTLKPEVLHCVDLAEGMMRETATFRYTIENAGCKTFRIQAPRPGVPLTVTGRGVAKVFESDPEKGIWQVELSNKAEQSLLLRASCQTPFDPAARQAVIRPFRAIDTESQRGYVTVTASGRMQVKPIGEPTGLKPEDSRGLPADFGAGDLSDAILCYRAVLPDYALTLDVQRHGSAAVLPARIRSVRLTSVLAEDGQLLTRIQLDLDAGDLRFLTMTLPADTDSLWSVFVNGKVGRPSREGRAYRIPLEAALEGEATSLDMVYAGAPGPDGNLLAPAFDLPLNNVSWTLYLRPGRTYFDFGGDFTVAERRETPVPFDQSWYSRQNTLLNDADLARAKSVMAKGESYIKQGAQKEAKQALEAAMNYSQGSADFNEDARIQYNNLVRKQAIVGLVQRRNELQEQRQLDVEVQQQAAPPNAGYNAGNFTPDYARKLEQTLSADESANLYVVADKIIGQQKAAAAVARSIRVTIPEQGVKIEVLRPLVIEPNAVLRLTWRSVPAAPWRKAGTLALVLAGLALTAAVKRQVK